MSSIDRIVPWAAMLAACAALAGCAQDTAARYGYFQGPNKSALDQYQAKVTAAPEELGIQPHMQGLSARQQAALDDFAQRWKQTGEGGVALRRPAQTRGDDTEALRATAFIVEYLVSVGVPSEAIRQTTYPANAADAPVLLRFSALKVETPDCSQLWDNWVSTNQNAPSRHFGCAMIANAAVQVADPHDLTRPAGQTPSDASRRIVVLGKYRDGKTTGAERDEQSSAAVSTAVK